ncbi:zinc metalloproteinase nas-36-like [Haliotis rufescens]|uniref:zinc metalloproteinase nas-36-like n=1 Tax=Haliotis rufescens TaxID=6454 RepID=UPI00201FAD4B|nr:zinc metalloproteinase nas-36-like [Haliotis rufescens]
MVLFSMWVLVVLLAGVTTVTAEKDNATMSDEAKRMVGQTINMGSMMNLTNIQLTLGGLPLNMTGFTLTFNDALILDSILRGRSIMDLLYIAGRLADIEGMIANALNLPPTSVAIESIFDPADDIPLDRSDVDAIIQDLNDDPTILDFLRNSSFPARRKRKALVDSKWPGTVIPYQITSDFDSFPASRQAILDGIAYWEEETCLDFQDVGAAAGSKIVFRRLVGCWSYLGMKPYPQTVSIGDGCNQKALVAREIGHALGFVPEHRRPDRDIYVSINWINVRPGQLHKFLRSTWRRIITLGVPYDYSSLLHYDAFMFNSNGQKTITGRQPDVDRTFGFSKALSFYDVKLANLRYCSGSCPQGLETPMCLKDGYRNPKNCSYCKCTDGLTGRNCESVEPGRNAVCGATSLVANPSWQVVTSPGYNTTGYTAFSECSWLLTAPNNTTIAMRFSGPFEFPCQSPCMDFVEVRFTDLARTGPRYCCATRPLQYFRSHGNEALLLFRANSSLSRQGFALEYRTEPCGGCSGGDSVQPCLVTQRVMCPGVFSGNCNFWGFGRCTTRRQNTCYRLAQTCCEGYRLVNNTCYRTLSDWAAWSACSTTCGGCGTRTRTRTCIRPPCSESLTETERCNTQICSGTTVTRVCSASFNCGWWFIRRQCVRYFTCYRLNRCCTGRVEQNGLCN